MQRRDKPEDRSGRKAALVIAGTGVFWILATLIGAEYGWSNRTRALFDVIALAGFGLAVVMIYKIWRMRQNDQG